jgi:hypothetical protein
MRTFNYNQKDYTCSNQKKKCNFFVVYYFCICYLRVVLYHEMAHKEASYLIKMENNILPLILPILKSEDIVSHLEH